jgi:hypothetical protein
MLAKPWMLSLLPALNLLVFAASPGRRSSQLINLEQERPAGDARLTWRAVGCGRAERRGTALSLHA